MIKVLTDSVSGEGYLLGLLKATFLLCYHMDFPVYECRERGRELWYLILIYKETYPIGPRPHPHDLLKPQLPPNGPIFKYHNEG